MRRRSGPGGPVGAGRDDFAGGRAPSRAPPNRGGAAGPHGGGAGPQQQGTCAFKLLCPDSLVVRLLGARGSKVETVQADTNTYFSFSRRDAYYPGTRMRLLVIRAEEPEAIMDALAAVVDEIVRCAEEEQAQLQEGQDGDFFTASGNYRIRAALCQKSAGSIIGLKGQRIGAMRQETGATINIRSEVVEGHQMVEVDGSVDQLFKVLEQMNKSVQADTGAAWFADWAHQKSFGEVPGASGPDSARRKGGGKGDTAGGGHDRAHTPTGAHEFRGEGATIFVKGLTQATATADLHRYFSHFGNIDEAEVKTNQQTRRNKGFGFVTFSDPAAAAHVLGSAEKHTIDGKRVEVKRFDHVAFGRGARGGDDLGGSRRGARDRDSREPHRRGGGARDRDHRSRSRDRPPLPPSRGRDADWFLNLADRVNPDYFDLDYSIEFSMPNKSCGALLGRGGQLVREVEQEAGVCITFSKKDDVHSGVPEGYRKISIKGALISVYGAHMLLMRNYNEAEAEFHKAGPAKRRIEELQRELEALQSQVRGS